MTEQIKRLLIDPESVVLTPGTYNIIANGRDSVQGKVFMHTMTYKGFSLEMLKDCVRGMNNGVKEKNRFVVGVGIDESRSYGDKGIVYDCRNLAVWEEVNERNNNG